MNLIKRALKVQAFCMIMVLGFSMAMPVFVNFQLEREFTDTPNEPMEDDNRIPENRGTRGIENYDWPMFHHNVYMTGAQDPSVTVPGNTIAYLFDSGGDIEAIPAVVGDWVFFGNRGGPGDQYTFYGLNETDSWIWKYSTANNWPWSSSPAVADIPGYGLMVFSGQSYTSTSNPPFYGFDADPDDNNDGVVDASDTDEGVADPPGAEYDIIWTTTLANGFGRHSPLIADIPALGGQVIYMGTNNGPVYCIDAFDGSIIWTWTDPTGDGFTYSHPTLGYDVNDNPMVFIINDDSGVSNTFYALDAVGGAGTTTIKWQTNLHQNAVRGGPAVEVGSPGADDDRVFFVTWDNPVILYCYDATPDDNGDNVIGGIGDTDEGTLDAPGSGYDLIWSYQLGTSSNYAASTPALHNGRVFVGIADSTLANNRLYALAANTTNPWTHVVWSYDAPGDMYWSCPAVADGKVVISTRGYWGTDAGVAVVDENTGLEIWTNTAVFSDDIETSCAVAKGKIYVGGDDNIMHVFGIGGFNNPPEIPILYSPEDTSIVITSGVMLDWSDSIDPNGDSVSYKIEINDTNDFISPAYTYTGVGASHLQVSPPDSTWFWRVRAIDEFGAQSDWSEVWSFTFDTINDGPSVTVDSPNGGEVWNGVHLITWTASEPENENVTFNILLSSDSGGTYNIILTSGIGTHVREWAFDTTTWPDDTTYRIKVEIVDARGLTSVDTSDNDFEIDHSSIIYDDWPQFMHYSNKTSQAFIDAPDSNGIAWMSTPGDPPRSIQVSPAIFGGKVFFGDHYNRFLCINETDGSLEWAYRYSATSNWPDGAPAVGWIPILNTYAVFMASDADGYTFIAFDVDGLSDGDQGIAEGTIPIVVADSFNADVLWAFESGGNVYTSHPLVEGNVVYMWLFNFTSSDAQLYAFDINGLFNGDDNTRGIVDADIGMADRIWEWECPTMFNTPPTYGDGRIYIGSYTDSPNDNIFAFDADPSDGVDEGSIDPPGSSFDMLWSNSLTEGYWGAPNFDNGKLFIATDDSSGVNNFVHSLNATDGSVIWQTNQPSHGRIQAAPAYWNDRMYVVTWGGGSWVYCYDTTPEDGIDEGYDDPPAATYDLIWQYDVPGEPRGQPAVSDNKVYIATRSSFNWGALICLDAIGDGSGGTREIWSYYDLDDDFYAGPAIANGYVYQTAFGGKVYKFGVPTTPDLAVYHEDIMFDPPTPGANNTWVDITVRVSNLAQINATDALLRIIIDANDNGQYDSGEVIVHNATISNVPGYEEVLVAVPWFASPVDYYNFIVEIDPLDDIYETFEDNNLAWNFYAVDVFATVDYIIINDTAGPGENWIGDKDYMVSDTDTFYAHGFNYTEGYLGEVSANWSSNDTGVGTVNLGPGTTTTFTAIAPGYCKVTAIYVNDPSITNETGNLHVLEYEVDYIVIVDSEGVGANEISDQTVTIGTTIQGWAAAFNNTGGYIGDVSVTWTVDNTGSTAATNPSPGTNSTFDADTNPGTAIWTADDGAGHNNTVVFTITDYTIDSILIVDTPNSGVTEIPDQTVNAGFTITGWAAAFNDSAGYLGDISVFWTVDNVSSTATTDPSSGANSTFDAGSSGGTATWTADDGSGHTDTVVFNINPPALDFIVIVDSGGSGAMEIPNQIVNVGFTITGWAAGFNSSAGYIGDVSVTWSVINVGSNAQTSPPFGITSNFDAGDTGGSATWLADDALGHSDTVIFTINPPEIDYITIVDSAGSGTNEIADQTVPIDFTIQGWAASFNDTIGYIGDISVSWTVNNAGSSATTNPPSGTSSTFDADVNPGTATWTANDGSGHVDTVIFTVTDVTVDSILIVDTSNTGSTEIPDQAVPVGFTILGWAAAFNDSAGYIGDISVSWTVNNIGSTATTNPPSGTSSTFDADSNPGTATWTADDGDGHTDTVLFTINPPTLDYIVIVDSGETGATEIPDQTVDVGFTIQGWAAGFNTTVGYYVDISVTWSVENIGSTASTNPFFGTNSTFDADLSPGNATWTADDGAGHNDTVVFSINPPKVDYIVIVDTQGTGVTEILDQTVDVGFTIQGWAAAFNNTVDYIGDISVTWSVDNVSSNASTNPLLDISSTFNAGMLGGQATWTADDGSGNIDTVVFTINPPEIDNIQIVDSENLGTVEIPDQDVNIGIAIQGWAASFNDTAGYIGDIFVTWSVDNIGSNATTTPIFGSNSSFYSGLLEGTVTWTADDGFGHNDTVVFTLNPPTVDYILIVDSPNSGTTEIPDDIIPVSFTIQGWAAGYNYTLGYYTDVSVTWSVINSGSDAETNPLGGTNSTFNAELEDGTATWRAEDGLGNTDTVIYTINPPTIDYIQIRDAQDGGGSIVIDPIYPVGETDRFYAALVNFTFGFIENAPQVTVWTSDDETIVTVTSPGEYTDIDCSEQNYGTILLSVDDQNGHQNSTSVRVLEPTVDELKIMNTSGGAGSEIANSQYPVGSAVFFYGAMFNDTTGYFGDVSNSATWSSTDTIVAVTSPGSSSTITCSDTESGTATITLDDGLGHQASVLVEILEPTIDNIQLKDAIGPGGNPLEDHTLSIGESETYYAIGYNDTAGDIGGVQIEWSSSNSNVGVLSDLIASSTTFNAYSDKVGETTISARYDGNDIGSFVVSVVDEESPTADAGLDQIIQAGDTVQFDGTGSEDNLEIESYTWTFTYEGDLVELDGEMPTYEFTEPGTYTITLEVTDSGGNWDSDTLIVVVEGEETQPAQENSLWLLLLLFLIIVVVLVLFMLSRKKKGKSECKQCGKEFFPQSEIEAQKGICPNCAAKSSVSSETPIPPPMTVQQETPPPPPPPPSDTAAKRTMDIKCPSCQKEFTVEIPGEGVMTVTCPHCGTSGQMKV